MKDEDKILLADFVEFIYHYPELGFWNAVEQYKKRKFLQKEESFHDFPLITKEEINDD